MECSLGETRSQTCHDFVAWDFVTFGFMLLLSAAIGLYFAIGAKREDGEEDYTLGGRNMTALPIALSVNASGLSAITGIGVFFAVRSRNKTDDADDYLLGGRKMSAVPVSLSLSASFMSAITVMGTPAEFYIYGTMFWYYAVAYLMVAVIVSEIYIPVFYRLRITSIYESVRVLATTVYILNTVIYVGICIYAPALALNEVTGLGIWWSVVVTAVVCTFYTTLGGLKAVVWTDVFQCMVMWIGFVAVLIRGSIVLGGFDKIWQTAEEGERIKFDDFRFDPTIRHTFWSITIGGTFLWTGTYGTTQSMVQRYLSCKSEKHARGAVFLNVIGLWIILILVGFSGLTMYAYYAGCDPYTQGWIGATDQLMPYFVLELLHDYPGLPGVYVCAAFSGTLSTVSTGINAMSTVTVEDYIKPFKQLDQRKSVILSKIFVIVYGVVCMLMAVLASQLGGVLQAALSINGLVGGAMVGLFTLGMILPWCNTIGAFVGLVCGLASATWVYVGSTVYPPPPEKVNRLTLCTNMCNSTADVSCGFNPIENDNITSTSGYFTTTEATTTQTPPIAVFYSVSYCYYPVIGFCVTVVIGMITSFLTGYQHPSEVHPGTIRPVFDHPVFCWLPEKVRRFLWCGVRHDEEKYDTERIGSLYNVDKIIQNNLSQMGNYKYYGESPILTEKSAGDMNEKQLPGYMTESTFRPETSNDNGDHASNTHVNYSFHPDEMSTSL